MTQSINIVETQADNLQNVQQTDGLSGPVNGQALMVDSIVREAVNQPTDEESQTQELRKILAETLITTDTEVGSEEYALSIDGIGIFALDDIHAIKAKQKHGKTTALKVCAAALMKQQQFRLKSELQEPRVLWIDTEQKRVDVKLVLTDIMQMTGLDGTYINPRLHLHAQRSCDYSMLYSLLQQAIVDFRPQVVFIDGIVEFVASFNDEAIAKELIHNLQVLSSEYHCAIVSVLHTNKSDEDHNMRGHLGTMLAQKAGTVLECRKYDHIITVSCTESRHAEAPDWSIMFNENGDIVDADEQRRQYDEQRKAEQQQKRQEASEKEKQERLNKCLQIINNQGGAISRKQLTESLVKVLDRERSTVASYISQWLKDEVIFDVDGMIQTSKQTELRF